MSPAAASGRQDVKKMVQILVQHKVKDFDAWLPKFRAHAGVRKQYGCESADVSRTLADPNDVVIRLTWRSAAAFQDFLEKSDLKERMAEAGVLAPPTITIGTDATAWDGGDADADAGADAPASRKVVETYLKDVFNGGRLDLVEEIYAPDYVNRLAPPGLPQGPAGVKALLGMARAAFPDLTARVVSLVAEGDRVAWHVEASGTHQGEFLGVAATGKKVSWHAMAVDRVREGRIVERDEVFDLFGIMGQIGGNGGK